MRNQSKPMQFKSLWLNRVKPQKSPGNFPFVEIWFVAVAIASLLTLIKIWNP